MASVSQEVGMESLELQICASTLLIYVGEKNQKKDEVTETIFLPSEVFDT